MFFMIILNHHETNVFTGASESEPPHISEVQR